MSPVPGVHVPMCNERCIGNKHYLLPSGPFGEPFRNQADRDDPEEVTP